MARTKRYAERVNIVKNVRVNGAWKLASVLERNGKVVRDHVLISGHDEHHPEGAYYLEWYQDGKRRRQAVGDFSEVVEAARRKSIEINAQKVGIIEASLLMPGLLCLHDVIADGLVLDEEPRFVEQEELDCVEVLRVGNFIRRPAPTCPEFNDLSRL